MKLEIDRLFKRVFFTVTAAACALTAAAAQVETLEIVQDGTNKIPQEMLTVTMRLRPGSEYSREFLDQLPKWEGDQIFLDLLWQDAPFFLLTLRYDGDKLTEAVLDGQKIR